MKIPLQFLLAVIIFSILPRTEAGEITLTSPLEVPLTSLEGAKIGSITIPAGEQIEVIGARGELLGVKRGMATYWVEKSAVQGHRDSQKNQAGQPPVKHRSKYCWLNHLTGVRSIALERLDTVLWYLDGTPSSSNGGRAPGALGLVNDPTGEGDPLSDAFFAAPPSPDEKAEDEKPIAGPWILADPETQIVPGYENISGTQRQALDSPKP